MVCDLMAGMSGKCEGGRLKPESEFTSCLFCTDAEGELYATAQAEAKACGHRKPGLLVIDWRLVWQLARFVRKHRIQLLHAHNHAPNLYGVLVSLLTGVPVVVTRHGQGYKTLRWKILTRLLAWRARRVVLVSDDAKRVAIANHSVPAKKAMVIHNGIDTSRFGPKEAVDGRQWTVDGKSEYAEGEDKSVEQKVAKHAKGIRLSTTQQLNNPTTLLESNVYGLKSDVSSRLRSTLGIPVDAVVIGSVGRLSPEKNYPLLVRAFSHLVQGKSQLSGCQVAELPASGESPAGTVVGCQVAKLSSVGPSGQTSTTEQQNNSTTTRDSAATQQPSNSSTVSSGATVFLLLVGDGNDRARIETELDRLGVRNHCHITGMVSDVRPWLGMMDVFCLSSNTEGLSISLLEAGAIGLPSVVTDVGGNREVIVDGQTGFLVPKGDEHALAKGLNQFVNDEDLRSKMGAASLRNITDNFSFTAMLDAYERLYESAVNR